MALIKTEVREDGEILSYHRVSEVRMTDSPPLASMVVESFESFESRANPGSVPVRRSYDFVLTSGDAMQQAYRALMANDEWSDAQSDASSEPGLIPAVEADTMEWDAPTLSWHAPPLESLQEAMSMARDRIDNAAGQARMRYITSVPGQSETYMRKELQAREWLAVGFSGEAPSFILAESIETGEQACDIAAQIIELADYWANIKGPQIEAKRMRWKKAISQASNKSQIMSMMSSAVTELDSL